MFAILRGGPRALGGTGGDTNFTGSTSFSFFDLKSFFKKK
jgi:hypothetical protein